MHPFFGLIMKIFLKIAKFTRKLLIKLLFVYAITDSIAVFWIPSVEAGDFIKKIKNRQIATVGFTDSKKNFKKAFLKF